MTVGSNALALLFFAKQACPLTEIAPQTPSIGAELVIVTGVVAVAGGTCSDLLACCDWLKAIWKLVNAVSVTHPDTFLVHPMLARFICIQLTTA